MFKLFERQKGNFGIKFLFSSTWGLIKFWFWIDRCLYFIQGGFHESDISSSTQNTLGFLLQNNFCEFINREHKFKRGYCTQQLVWNVPFEDFWYTKINMTQIWYDKIQSPNQIWVKKIY
jgi:hypothetical protein